MDLVRLESLADRYESRGVDLLHWHGQCTSTESTGTSRDYLDWSPGIQGKQNLMASLPVPRAADFFFRTLDSGVGRDGLPVGFGAKGLELDANNNAPPKLNNNNIPTHPSIHPDSITLQRPRHSFPSLDQYHDNSTTQQLHSQHSFPPVHGASGHGHINYIHYPPVL
jgi:hypothetical protein